MPQITEDLAGRYAAAVVRVLADDFRALKDETVRRIVTESVARQAFAPVPSFEVIVDDLSSANWRLTADRDDQRRVRLGCFRMRPHNADDERKRRINTTLCAIELED